MRKLVFREGKSLARVTDPASGKVTMSVLILLSKNKLSFPAVNQLQRTTAVFMQAVRKSQITMTQDWTMSGFLERISTKTRD